jgi:hypothetical protein
MNKRLVLKIMRFSLKCLFILGALLAVVAFYSGLIWLGLLALALPGAASLIFHCWADWELKHFYDSYQPGHNVVYTDSEGLRRSASLVRFEPEHGRVVVKETNVEGVEHLYVIPMCTFIVSTIEDRQIEATAAE